MAAPTNAANVKKVLVNSEPSTHGTFETSTDVRYSAAFGGNLDSEPTLPQGPSLTRIVLRCVPSVTIEPIVKCYTWQNFL
jgi:hypothetical protein